MPEERRKSVRIKKVLTVMYSCGADEGEKKWDMTAIRDISETGMSFATHKEFAPNDVINFLIKIPTKPLDWIEFTGRVVGSESSKALSGEPLVGSHITRIEFINLQDEHKELVRQYIVWFLSKEGGGQK